MAKKNIIKIDDMVYVIVNKKKIPYTGMYESNEFFEWYEEGKLHKLDGPAVLRKKKSKAKINAVPNEKWYKKGKIHRDGDEPALIFSNGNKKWFKNGEIHRDKGPAVIELMWPSYKDTAEFWYKQGKIHRDNDEPAVECSNGYKAWWFKGKLHRDNDKPAMLQEDGTKIWYKHGLVHRENNKPAIESYNYKAWYINNKFIKSRRGNFGRSSLQGIYHG